MVVSYNKLWHLLIEKKLKKSDLRRQTNMSSSTLANLVNENNVSLSILLKICTVLECNFSDIIDAIPAEKSDNSDEIRKK